LAGQVIGAGDRDPRGDSEVFVGRVRESARLADCAAEVRDGRARLAVIEGEAGIGKSALVRRLAASLTDYTVLWATGDPSETELPGGVLEQLTRRLNRAVAEQYPLVSDPTAAGLSAHAVGGELLLLLGALQEAAGPVAVMVDDFQWADPFSAQVLGFVLRRLWADRVLTVLVARSDTDAAGAGAGTGDQLDRLARSVESTVRVTVAGLKEDDVAQVALGLLGERLAPGLVERLHTYTKGHPLHLRTVLAEVPVQTLRDQAADRWPVPRSLWSGIGKLLDGLPADSLALIRAMAVLDTRLPLTAVAQVAGLSDPARALEPALTAGLARWWPTEPHSPVELVHALQRDAVYDAIDPELRRTLHRRAAAVVGTAAAWAHRVAAADGADPGLAAELEASTLAEAAAGRNALAATRLMWASALSATTADRDRRLLTACAQSLLTMQPVTALMARSQVEDCAPGALRSCVLGVMDMLDNQFTDAVGRLTEAWEQALADPESSWVAILAGTFLTFAVLRQGRGADTVTIAAKTLAIGDLDPATTDLTRAVLATGRLWDQGPRAALGDLTHLPAESAAATNQQLDTLATRGVMRLFIGDLAGARADLALVAQRDRQGAAPKLGHQALSMLALVEFLSGDWDAAESTAERTLAIAASQGHPLGDAASGFAAVCLQAGRGQWDAAEAHVEELARTARLLSSAIEIVYWALGAATLAQARADHPGMLRALEPLIDRDAASGDNGPIPLRYQPFRFWQRSLLVEALTGVGRLDEAARTLREMEEDHDGSGFLRIVVAQLGGRLDEARNRPQDALARYERAVGAAGAGSGEGYDGRSGQDAAPFFRALVEHDYGRLLVKTGAGSRRSAAAWFRSAHDRLSALRAAPFLERCDADLAAIGLATPAAARDGLLAMTERELSVAHLIAEGRTNQQAAAELYVTQKTVEYHLSNIYGKLGIGSRRELAAIVRTEQS
jgi:DNA-binding CsgD family transcriptional regulator